MDICLFGLPVMAISAYSDLKTGNIYNKLMYPAIILSLLIIAVFYPQNFMASLKWGLIAWLIILPVVILDQASGGDSKLLALAGIMLQEYVIVVYFFFMLLVLLYFIGFELKCGHSIGKIFGHLLKFKNFIMEGTHHNVGGLLIFLSTLTTYILLLQKGGGI